jgi:hypothetical protein
LSWRESEQLRERGRMGKVFDSRQTEEKNQMKKEEG